MISTQIRMDWDDTDARGRQRLPRDADTAPRLVGRDESSVDGPHRTRLSLAESGVRGHIIQQRRSFSLVNLSTWILADAVRAAGGCHQSPTANRTLGYLLGVLVQDRPDGLGASRRVGAGASANDRHGHAASAALWRDSSCTCVRLSVSHPADAKTGLSGSAVRHYSSRDQEAEDRRLASLCRLCCWLLSLFITRELHAFLHVGVPPSNVLGFAIKLRSFHLYLIFSLFLITFMLLRRFLQTQRKREQWKTEIEQAQQVQHVLIPDELPTIAGFAIESEYRPAREVGGDLFQILPGQEPGSALVVVGDVTGKGLQAGMLVAVIVGAIRNAAQYHSDPLILMNSLNDQLSGRVGAIATCLILRISADGEVTLANAGHLAPYLNGVEMQMEMLRCQWGCCRMRILR